MDHFFSARGAVYFFGHKNRIDAYENPVEIVLKETGKKLADIARNSSIDAKLLECFVDGPRDHCLPILGGKQASVTRWGRGQPEALGR